MLSTDPLDFLLDDDGDLVVTTDVAFTSGIEGVAQLVRTRIQTFRGELFQDVDFGVPYWQDLLGQKFDIVRARAAFRDIILKTPGVLGLVTYSVEFDGPTRTLHVTWSVRTLFGDTTEETLEI